LTDILRLTQTGPQIAGSGRSYPATFKENCDASSNPWNRPASNCCDDMRSALSLAKPPLPRLPPLFTTRIPPARHSFSRATTSTVLSRPLTATASLAFSLLTEGSSSSFSDKQRARYLLRPTAPLTAPSPPLRLRATTGKTSNLRSFATTKVAIRWHFPIL
jgi:hypothetical protein